MLSDKYINPFDSSLDKTNLFNLSSGVPVSEDVATDLLSFRKLGEEKHKQFEFERLDSKNVSFHHPIKRMKLKTWKSSEIKMVVSKNEKKSKC